MDYVYLGFEELMYVERASHTIDRKATAPIEDAILSTITTHSKTGSKTKPSGRSESAC